MVDRTLLAEGEARREEILQFIRDYTAEHGWGPSGAQIAAAIGVSATAVSKHIRRLVFEGRISRADRLSRGVRIVNDSRS